MHLGVSVSCSSPGPGLRSLPLLGLGGCWSQAAGSGLSLLLDSRVRLPGAPCVPEGRTGDAAVLTDRFIHVPCSVLGEETRRPHRAGWSVSDQMRRQAELGMVRCAPRSRGFRSERRPGTGRAGLQVCPGLTVSSLVL